MKKQLRALVPLPLVLLALLGCGKDSSTNPPDNPAPEFVPSDFVAGVDSPFMPLIPGTVLIYEGESDGQIERVEYEITAQTKVILGVTCMVVRDRVYFDGELEEDTFDWYAQHDNGDVWYFGEDSKEIANGQVVSTEGSWEAGVDGAKPGILIKATPVVGDTYQQEYYEDEAEDMAQVVALDATATTPLATYTNCLKTKEWNPLDSEALPEFKFYARGVGMVREEAIGGDAVLELVEIRRP